MLSLFLIGCAAPPNHDTGPALDSEAQPPDLQGQVQVSEMYMPMMGSWMLGATASFIPADEVAAAVPLQTAGSCSLFEGSAGGSGPSGDAGLIQVEGPTATLELRFESDGYEGSSSSSEDLFVEGETLAFVAEGGADVPAFSSEVEAPPELEVLAPDLSSGSFSVSRDEDLLVAWTPHDGGTLHIELSAGSLAISCSAPDATGELVVPTELLAELPKSSNMGGMIMMDRTVRESTIAGDALVAMELQSGLGLMGRVE